LTVALGTIGLFPFSGRSCGPTIGLMTRKHEKRFIPKHYGINRYQFCPSVLASKSTKLFNDLQIELQLVLPC
jgi:hypothetical protein